MLPPACGSASADWGQVQTGMAFSDCGRARTIPATQPRVSDSKREKIICDKWRGSKTKAHNYRSGQFFRKNEVWNIPYWKLKWLSVSQKACFYYPEKMYHKGYADSSMQMRPEHRMQGMSSKNLRDYFTAWAFKCRLQANNHQYFCKRRDYRAWPHLIPSHKKQLPGKMHNFTSFIC